ncbi:hypothetical protein LTR85_008677 [Meristemomyces frigidus]|nr:hypothetical protein LTR85_008677 [Meristemomyces frigidus]
MQAHGASGTPSPGSCQIQTAGASVQQPGPGEGLRYVEQTAWTNMTKEAAELEELLSGSGGGRVVQSGEATPGSQSYLGPEITSPPGIDWDFIDQVCADAQHMDLGFEFAAEGDTHEGQGSQ